MGEIALIGSYTYKKFIPKDIKTLGADEKSAHPAVIFRADFCKDGAGNTLAVLSSRTCEKMYGKARRGACFCPSAPSETKKASRVSACFSKFIPNKKGEALFPKAGFHLYSWADALE